MELVLATFTALFSVVNPFGAMPVFLALTEGYSKEAKKEQALKACIYMFCVLVVFFFAGTFILNFFGLRIEDLRIAGGLLIIRSGMGLLDPDAHKGKKLSKEVEKEGMEKEDISFTPLAMPMLSGPGSIAVTIAMFGRAGDYVDMALIVVAILLVALLSFVILRSSATLTRFLGKGGMSALARMMGFIILSIGVSLIVNGILSLISNFIRA
jgi:multiple antibiotic resistance protein